MALFAIDEGFPETIFDVAELLPRIDLVRLADIDPRLVGNSDDWAILVRLHQLPEPFDGLVTIDSGIHEQQKEMVVLEQTRLTVLEILDSGHDAVRATAMALLWLPYVAQETRPDKPQIWFVRPPAHKHWDKPGNLVSQMATNAGESRQQVLNRERLSEDELGTDLWDWYEGTQEAY